MLLAICIKYGNRIAIGNPDHAPGKRFGLNRARQKKKNDEADQNRFGSRPSCTAQYSKITQPITGMKLSN